MGHTDPFVDGVAQVALVPYKPPPSKGAKATKATLFPLPAYIDRLAEGGRKLQTVSLAKLQHDVQLLIKHKLIKALPNNPGSPSYRIIMDTARAMLVTAAANVGQQVPEPMCFECTAASMAAVFAGKAGVWSELVVGRYGVNLPMCSAATLLSICQDAIHATCISVGTSTDVSAAKRAARAADCARVTELARTERAQATLTALEDRKLALTSNDALEQQIAAARNDIDAMHAKNNRAVLELERLHDRQHQLTLDAQDAGRDRVQNHFVPGPVAGECSFPWCTAPRAEKAPGDDGNVRHHFCTKLHRNEHERVLLRLTTAGGPLLAPMSCPRPVMADDMPRCSLPGCGLSLWFHAPGESFDYCCRGHSAGSEIQKILIGAAPLDAIINAYPVFAELINLTLHPDVQPVADSSTYQRAQRNAGDYSGYRNDDAIAALERNLKVANPNQHRGLLGEALQHFTRNFFHGHGPENLGLDARESSGVVGLILESASPSDILALLRDPAKLSATINVALHTHQLGQDMSSVSFANSLSKTRGADHIKMRANTRSIGTEDVRNGSNGQLLRTDPSSTPQTTGGSTGYGSAPGGAFSSNSSATPYDGQTYGTRAPQTGGAGGSSVPAFHHTTDYNAGASSSGQYSTAPQLGVGDHRITKGPTYETAVRDAGSNTASSYRPAGGSAISSASGRTSSAHQSSAYGAPNTASLYRPAGDIANSSASGRYGGASAGGRTSSAHQPDAYGEPNTASSYLPAGAIASSSASGRYGGLGESKADTDKSANGWEIYNQVPAQPSSSGRYPASPASQGSALYTSRSPFQFDNGYISARLQVAFIAEHRDVYILSDNSVFAMLSRLDLRAFGDDPFFKDVAHLLTSFLNDVAASYDQNLLRLQATNAGPIDVAGALETGHRVMTILSHNYIFKRLGFQLPHGVDGLHATLAINVEGHIVPVLAYLEPRDHEIQRAYPSNASYQYAVKPSTTALSMIANLRVGNRDFIEQLQREAQSQSLHPASCANPVAYGSRPQYGDINAALVSGSSSAIGSGQHRALGLVDDKVIHSYIRHITAAVTSCSYKQNATAMDKAGDVMVSGNSTFQAIQGIKQDDVGNASYQRIQHTKSAKIIDNAATLIVCQEDVGVGTGGTPDSLVAQFTAQFLRTILGSPQELNLFLVTKLLRITPPLLRHLSSTQVETYVNVLVVEISKQPPILVSSELYALANGLAADTPPKEMRILQLGDHWKVLDAILGVNAPILIAVKAHCHEIRKYETEHGDLLVKLSIEHVESMLNEIAEAFRKFNFANIDFTANKQLSVSGLFQRVLNQERRILRLERAVEHQSRWEGQMVNNDAAATSGHDSNHQSKGKQAGAIKYKPSEPGKVYTNLPLNDRALAKHKKAFYKAFNKSGIPWDVCWAMVSRWVALQKPNVAPSACLHADGEYCSSTQYPRNLMHLKAFQQISPEALATFSRDVGVRAFCRHIQSNPRGKEHIMCTPE